jgi:glycosyltransferase involved in cell wall biosynthesis
MRIALLMQLAPRKLGSFERWLLGMAQTARQRGHSLDVYGLEPVHPELARGFAECGAGSHLLVELPPRSWSSRRRLAAYDVIHLNLMAPRSPHALLAYAAFPARVVFADHTSGDAHPGLGLLSRLADRFTFARVSQVLGVSDFVTERDRRRFGLPQGRAHTVYNGVEVPTAPAAKPDGPAHLIAAAYLIPQKGIHHLLAACAAVRHLAWRLSIVGDGPQRPALEALAQQLGIFERVEFLGLRDDVPALMAQAHLFAHPARWGEAFGLTVAEAMAAGCAVVASRVGAMPELLESEQTGLLVPPGDEGALAAALERLIMSPEERARMGAAAWQVAHTRFTLERCVREHLAACEGAPSAATLQRGETPALAVEKQTVSLY